MKANKWDFCLQLHFKNNGTINNNKKLKDRLRDLIKANNLENKPHNRTKSYCIVENEETTIPKEISLSSNIVFPEETPILSPILTDTYTSEFFELRGGVDLVKKFTESVNAKIEAIKMFMKDQFCLIKTSNSEQNVYVSTENTKVIELLQQQNQNLIQENASKNTIQNRHYLKNLERLIANFDKKISAKET